MCVSERKTGLVRASSTPRVVRITDRDRIVVEGTIGRLSLRLANAPLQANPRTSYLAAASAIRRMMEPLELG